MARAKLVEVDPPEPSVPGTRAFIVTDANPWTEPFSGWPGRRWSNFNVHGAAFASFEWKSRVDDIIDIAKRVVAGGLSPHDARENAGAGPYLEERLDGRDDDDELDVATVSVCRGIVDDVAALFELDAVYMFEGDSHLRDAAAALGPLPEWARVVFVDEGGPGSGFEQPVLVLGGGHGLDELRRWLLCRHLRLM